MRAAMSQWYCRIAGALSGPFPLDELEYLRDRGQLSASDEVRPEGSSSWQPASTITDLFPPAPAPPVVRATPRAATQPASAASPAKLPPEVPPEAANSLATPTEVDRRRKQLLIGTGIG